VPVEQAPLAVRMRPASVDELVGQEHLLHEGAPLRRALEGAAEPHSMILYGPPGTGKTTIARLLAASADVAFEELSAVEAGRAEVRAVLAGAEQRRRSSGRGTLLFLDEIHRFNRAQQDTLLPAVEEGLVVLVGATTENPYFEVTSALLSRCRVYELRALSAQDIEALLRRALARELRGAEADAEALAFLADRAGGDARTALAALELAAEATRGGRIGLEHAEEALQRRAVRYDRAGDQHYDTISAWIKATRASDPDGSLYWLAVMLEGGEDPRFIARRMVILASEDVGNADPSALAVATAAAAAVEHVGLPECQFALAQAAIHLALAPKSDAAKRAIGAARAWVREHGAEPPPAYLRSSGHPAAAAALGRGAGYDNPHDHPGHLSSQPVLPPGAAGQRFYRPDEAEAALAARLAEIRRRRALEP
jgi:putative ATPase